MPTSTTTPDQPAAGPADSSMAVSVLAAQMQVQAGAAAALLKALANADRLLLLCQMVDGERHVSELGELTGLQQPSLSQQLGVLRTEGLVATRREGKHMLYRIASPAALALLQTLYGLFCAPAGAPTPATGMSTAQARTPARTRPARRTRASATTTRQTKGPTS